MSNWISVRDRLPEIGVEVLICDMGLTDGYRRKPEEGTA